MFELKVTIGASPELQAVLDQIVGKLSTSTDAPVAKLKSTKGKAAPVVTEDSQPAAVVETETLQDVTIEMVRAEVNTQKEAGKREKIKALLTEFETDKVTSLDPKKYAPFLQKLKTL
jgi:hypothetical protein